MATCVVVLWPEASAGAAVEGRETVASSFPVLVVRRPCASELRGSMRAEGVDFGASVCIRFDCGATASATPCSERTFSAAERASATDRDDASERGVAVSPLGEKATCVDARLADEAVSCGDRSRELGASVLMRPPVRAVLTERAEGAVARAPCVVGRSLVSVDAAVRSDRAGLVVAADLWG